MAARKNRRNKRSKKDKAQDLTQVDIYYVPSDQAEMYQVLRERIAEEVKLELESRFSKVERKTIDPEEGEAIVAYGDDGAEAVRFALSPNNIAEAQSSHDKEKMNLFVENLIKNN